MGVAVEAGRVAYDRCAQEASARIQYVLSLGYVLDIWVHVLKTVGDREMARLE